jgi:hypothetical protein
MMTEVRAAGELSARPLGQPLCGRLKVHLFVSCGKKSGTSRDVPFLGLGPAIEMKRASQKEAVGCWRTASIGYDRPTRRDASLISALAGWLNQCSTVSLFIASFTSSAQRGTPLSHSSFARKPQRLFQADRFQSWDARQLVRRSAVCPRSRPVFPRTNPEWFDCR